MQTIPDRYRITTENYHQMGAIGIFPEDVRVELIDGELLKMAPIGSRHAGTVMQMVRLLNELCVGSALVNPQNPIALGEYSEPEPDIALLRTRSDFYKNALPAPADVLLIIEVAETSARYDRDIKLPLYAQHGIPEVWLIELSAGQMEIYRQPDGNRYKQVLRPGADERIAPELLPHIVVDLTVLGL